MSDNESIDPGMGGFSAIFGEHAAAAEPATETPTEDTGAQPEATSAEATSPETPDDGQELSAEDVVAARLAASLEADGIVVPDPGDEDEEETAETDGEALSLEDLTPEQYQAVLDELEELRAKTTTNDRQAIANKVIAAERQAVEGVWQEYNQQVVPKSEAHYRAEFIQRASKAYDQHETQPNPKQWLLGQIEAERAAVLASQRDYEFRQEQDYEQRAIQAAVLARKSVPELRQLYAQELATEFSLPAEVVVPLLLKVADTDNFRAEAERLAGVRDFAAKERGQKNAKKRRDANQELREAPVRTPATARPRGAEPREYKGKWDEGAAILRMLRNS
jgi:hypothetical protein